MNAPHWQTLAIQRHTREAILRCVNNGASDRDEIVATVAAAAQRPAAEVADVLSGMIATGDLCEGSATDGR